MSKLYAQRDTAIDGKHFKAGEEVKDVATEQLAIARRSGFVGPEKPAVHKPAPESTKEPVKEPATEPTKEPAKEPTKESAKE